jgi:2-keto-4-pentenoate hydratase/2-oxohepta-3-ene-1,7-dioic acid hydratase in catechol pathway
MRWMRFRKDGAVGYAAVEGEVLREVSGDPMGGCEFTGRKYSIGEVTFLPPIVPRNFFAVGFNYLGHTEEARKLLKKDIKVPVKPDVGSRFPSALIGHEQAVVIPVDSGGVIQFEGELVAIIGKPAKNLPEDEILSCVFGYSIGNDISERAWQSVDRTVWRSKSADTFSPFGPWIETDVDLDTLVTRIRLNGELVSEFETNAMLFGVARYLSEISKYMTLDRGDMIWMGAQAPSLDMKAGDTIEVEIDQIGVLRNPIVQGA